MKLMLMKLYIYIVHLSSINIQIKKLSDYHVVYK